VRRCSSRWQPKSLLLLLLWRSQLCCCREEVLAGPLQKLQYLRGPRWPVCQCVPLRSLARLCAPVVDTNSERSLVLAEQWHVHSVQATATRPAAAGSCQTLLCCARVSMVQLVKALM
jgi:hypothetical protein